MADPRKGTVQWDVPDCCVVEPCVEGLDSRSGEGWASPHGERRAREVLAPRCAVGIRTETHGASRGSTPQACGRPLGVQGWWVGAPEGKKEYLLRNLLPILPTLSTTE